VRLYEIGPGGAAAELPRPRLLGVPPDFGPPVDVSVDVNQAVVSLLVEPRPGLKFGTSYRLVFDDGIVDLDPTPKPLVPFTLEWKTQSPSGMGTHGGDFASPGVVVLAERAYLVENQFVRGLMRVFDVHDPAAPEELTSSFDPPLDPIPNRPVDVAGQLRGADTAVPAGYGLVHLGGQHWSSAEVAKWKVVDHRRGGLW
jgi:hypothetical protein